MLDLETRQAILRLDREGHGKRTIAQAVGVSRNSVKKVLASGSPEVPRLARADRLEPYLERILELYAECAGNLVRVHEKLDDDDVQIPYSVLTAFCRRNGIGVKPKKQAGRYHFLPGEEMQHDTSPHQVKVGGGLRTFQCASLVLCFSRMIHAQVFLRWSRFECRIFLSEAIEALGGAAGRTMIDNSSVILAGGSGKNAIFAPEMNALAKRFNFAFEAHEVGDANRSARVERPFHYIENNFYKGCSFTNLADLNAQLRIWCDKVNRRYKKHIRAVPIELFITEKPLLRPLPLYIPEVYDLYERRVDVQARVTLHTNRYSVLPDLIDRKVEVRETKERVRIFDGHKLVADHERSEYGAGTQSILPEHKYQRRQGRHRERPTPQEELLRGAAPGLSALLDALKKHHGGRAVRSITRLHRIWMDYPTDIVEQCVRRALEYGLMDLERIEKMILKQLAGRYFRLPTDERND